MASIEFVTYEQHISPEELTAALGATAGTESIDLFTGATDAAAEDGTFDSAL